MSALERPRPKSAGALLREGNLLLIPVTASTKKTPRWQVNPRGKIVLVQPRVGYIDKMRSKPAVPLAGRYRIIDIPISNCLNSGINQIFVLTQFNSASLNKHVVQTYKFDVFSGGSSE